jgi:hypothetical protein
VQDVQSEFQRLFFSELFKLSHRDKASQSVK